jgi:hypothetical protein
VLKSSGRTDAEVMDGIASAATNWVSSNFGGDQRV